MLSRLGADATGRLYLAHSPGGRRVAVKVIRAEVARDPEFRARLRREVAAAQRVSGAFTVPVVGSDTEATAPWIAVIYLAAPSLDKVIAAEGPPSAHSVRRLAAALAEALGAVHRARMIHGDLRPSTILVLKDGPRLIDFGVTRALDADTIRLMADPGYTSPERLLGEAASEASDIYALGAVLHFLATGRGPHGRGGTNEPDHPAAHSEPDLSGVSDDLLRESISACLATDPAARPTSENLLVHLHRALARPHEDVEVDRPPARHRRWSRRRFRRPVAAVDRRVAALVGVLSLLAAVGIGIANQPPDSGPRSNQSSPSWSPGSFWSLTKGAAGDYVGLWSTPSSVVLGTSTELTAYDPATRAKLWSWLPPKGSSLCNMSRRSSEGIGAFVYGTNDPDHGSQCDHLQTISLSSGTPNWTKAVTGVASGTPGTMGGDINESLSIGDGIVTAPFRHESDTETDLISVAVHGGTVNWSTDYGDTPMANGCILTGKAQEFNGKIYAFGMCDNYTRVKLLAFDGKSRSSASAVSAFPSCDPKGGESGSVTALAKVRTMNFLVAGADHLLIGCSADIDGDHLYTLRADSTRLTPVELTVISNMISANSLGSEIRMFNNTLYLLEPMPSAMDTGVVAVNMDTGKQLWVRKLPNDYSGRLLTADKSGVKVLAYETPSPTAIYSLAAADGSATKRESLNPKDSKALGKVTYPDPHAVSVGSYLALGFPSEETTENDVPVFAVLPLRNGGTRTN
ncbi:serine/threonine protein kinase [Streptomyces sp. NPDC087538]|uniref:serine/threonine protein kinase n=1 Tax=Streptomyces sp. NPDC087538 TaxID=3365797 RepID=UPI00382AE089